VGTWSEGGKEMGKDVFEMIRDFGARQDFRSAFSQRQFAVAHFVETFPDDGYVDMYR
jgi:D-mannonate dehydratase